MTTTPSITTAQQALFTPHELATLEGRPTIRASISCIPREVFMTEAIFEHHLKHDSEALAVIGEALGIDAGLVTTQVRVNPQAYQRADLVFTPTDSTTQPSIVELQLDPLDAEHVSRATYYAFTMGARDLAFIAPRMLPSAQAVFNELSNQIDSYNVPLQMHFLSLHTSFLVSENSAIYELRLETPPRAQPRVTLKALKAIAAFCIDLGDSSFTAAKFDDARRIDIYRGLAHGICIRLAAKRDATTLSIMRTPPEIRARLQAERLPEQLAEVLQPHSLLSWAPGEPHTTVLAAYHFPSALTIDLKTDIAAAREVAKAFIALHATLRVTLEERDHHPHISVRYATPSERTTHNGALTTNAPRDDGVCRVSVDGC